MMKRLFLCLFAVGCASNAEPPPTLNATVETVAVASSGDAADDPAIWVNNTDPAASLILGTDKQAGLYLYSLDGAIVQFAPAGRLNNVDLRQGVALGDFTGDLVAASNRTDNSITLFTIAEHGFAQETGRFPSSLIEPYGLCMGENAAGLFAFVAYKTGDLIAYRITGPYRGAEVARVKLASQLEGCVYDDEAGALYIGEEAKGIWKADFDGAAFGPLSLVDEVRAASGMKADVEGLTLYKTGAETGYLLASSQGNNSFTIYKREGENDFIKRFRIAPGAAIDGVEETDGIAASAAAFAPDFPEGLLVVQDGLNDGADTQNFKIIDWRAIEALISAAPEL